MTRNLLLGLFVLAAATATAQAGDCCAHCGCNSCCRKVCRLVCETKKVPKITYDCKCEDFCVPGPSKCVGVCDTCDCDKCGGHGCHFCCHKKKIYEPTCASLHTKKVLVKHVEMEEKRSYKWVVECVCDSCACKAQAEQVLPPDGNEPPVPPAPADVPVPGPPAPPAPKDNTALKPAPTRDYYADATEDDMLAPAPPPLTGSKVDKTEARGVSFMQSLFSRKPK